MMKVILNNMANTKNRDAITVYLKPEVNKKLAKLAETSGLSKSQLLSLCFEDYLTQQSNRNLSTILKNQGQLDSI